MAKKNKPKRRYNLDKRWARKHVKSYIDYDYLDQLTEEELDFLEQFSQEFYGARFRNNDSDLHNTDEQRRAVYRTNNARNRDMWHRHNRLAFDYTDDTEFDEDDE